MYCARTHASPSILAPALLAGQPSETQRVQGRHVAQVAPGHMGTPSSLVSCLHLHLPTPKQQPLQHALDVLAGLTCELPAIGGNCIEVPAGGYHLPDANSKAGVSWKA